MTEQTKTPRTDGLLAWLNRPAKHFECGDAWYSCPKSEDGCADDRQGDECNCGADAENTMRVLIATELATQSALLADMREALQTSVVALDDWLNVHAPEFCHEQRVTEARERINEYGTIAYIADVQQTNRAVLARAADIGGA